MPDPTPESSRPLTPKQEAFVREYLVDLNASAAAIRAGYSEVAARDIGWENLRKPAIQAALQEAMNARAERTEVTADKVLLELADIAFATPKEFSEWGIRFRPADKLRALELIAKHLGMLTDRAEVTGPGGGPIEIRELTDTDLLERAQAQSNRIALLMAAHRKKDGGSGNGNGSRPGP